MFPCLALNIQGYVLLLFPFKSPCHTNGDATTFSQRLYSVHGASTARKQLLQRIQGALTARTQRSLGDYSVFSLFNLLFLYFEQPYFANIVIYFYFSKQFVIVKSRRTCNTFSNTHILSSVH